MLSASALIAAPAVVRAAGPDTVRFGVLHPNLTTVIHEIAKRTGAYERNDLKVVETRFKSGQTVEGVEQLWRGNLDFYMGGAPEVPRLNSRLVESGSPPPLAVVSGANPGHTSLVLGNKLQPKTIDEIFKQPLRIAVSSLSSVHLAFFRGYLLTEKKLDLKSIALALHGDRWQQHGSGAAHRSDRRLPALRADHDAGDRQQGRPPVHAGRARRHGAEPAAGDA